MFVQKYIFFVELREYAVVFFWLLLSLVEESPKPSAVIMLPMKLASCLVIFSPRVFFVLIFANSSMSS